MTAADLIDLITGDHARIRRLLASLGQLGRDRGRPCPAVRPREEVIAMGAPQQDLDTSFAAYRQAIEMAEAARQRAIADALADHRRALEDIEAAYRRAVAAARCCYSQRNIGQRAAQAVA
jgi:hypothetical protein